MNDQPPDLGTIMASENPMAAMIGAMPDEVLMSTLQACEDEAEARGLISSDDEEPGAPG